MKACTKKLMRANKAFKLPGASRSVAAGIHKAGRKNYGSKGYREHMKRMYGSAKIYKK